MSSDVVLINRSNYYRLARILSKPRFGSSIGRVDDGQIILRMFHNTVGDRTLGHGNSSSHFLGRLPLLDSRGRIVILNDEYSIDLFGYQYGFFFSTTEKNYFRDHIIEKHGVSLKRLNKLREFGLVVCEQCREMSLH